MEERKASRTGQTNTGDSIRSRGKAETMKEDKVEVTYLKGGFLKVVINGWWETIGFMDYNAEPRQVSGRIYMYSPNQRKTIIAETEKLIDRYDTGDCPSMLRMLLKGIRVAG